MQVFWTLFRRELGTFFQSMTGYIIITAVVALLGFSLTDVISKLSAEPMDAPLTELFYSTFYFWLILLLTTPVITMRTFASEKSSGTFETLMTAPVSDLQVVLAKFAGTLTFFAITWLPSIGYMVFLQRFIDSPSTAWEPRAMTTTFFGIVLIGSLYIAMGCFASALTKSQLIAAAVSYAVGLTLFLLSMRMRSLVPIAASGWQAKVFAHISMVEHMEDFARGVIDTTPVIYYLSLTAFFVFLTFKVVESRRWKN
jgi:ABC-2 type transport system permease protein